MKTSMLISLKVHLPWMRCQFSFKLHPARIGSLTSGLLGHYDNRYVPCVVHNLSDLCHHNKEPNKDTQYVHLLSDFYETHITSAKALTKLLFSDTSSIGNQFELADWGTFCLIIWCSYWQWHTDTQINMQNLVIHWIDKTIIALLLSHPDLTTIVSNCWQSLWVLWYQSCLWCTMV